MSLDQKNGALYELRARQKSESENARLRIIEEEKQRMSAKMIFVYPHLDERPD